MGTLMNLPHSGQVPIGADRNSPDFGGLTDLRSTVNRFYFNSRVKEIRAMMELPTVEQRIARAKELIASDTGIRIDFQIDVITLDAFTTMTVRAADGLLGVKPLELADFATSLGTPGATDGSNYDRTPYMNEATLPATAIRTSIKLSDYPPAIDLQMRPRPFGKWPLNPSVAPGVGGEYESNNQNVGDGGPGAPWVNYADASLPASAVYEEIWTIRSGSLFPGGALRPYVFFRRIK